MFVGAWPDVVHATEQPLQALHSPGTRVPRSTLAHAVLCTTTFVSVSLPELQTVPENVTGVPATQPSVQVWLRVSAQVWKLPMMKSLSSALTDADERVSARNDAKQHTLGSSSVRLTWPSKKLRSGYWPVAVQPPVALGRYSQVNGPNVGAGVHWPVGFDDMQMKPVGSQAESWPGCGVKSSSDWRLFAPVPVHCSTCM